MSSVSSQEMSFSSEKVSMIAGFDSDLTGSISGMEEGIFAIASSKKALKTLMQSDTDVDYDAKKGKLYFLMPRVRRKAEVPCKWMA